jgi:hypothetical protein
MGSRTQRKFVREFKASDDAGNEYLISEYQDYIINQSLAGNTETVEGLKSFTVRGGGHVNRLDDDTFQAPGDTRRLRRMK